MSSGELLDTRASSGRLFCLSSLKAHVLRYQESVIGLRVRLVSGDAHLIKFQIRF